EIDQQAILKQRVREETFDLRQSRLPLAPRRSLVEDVPRMAIAAVEVAALGEHHSSDLRRVPAYRCPGRPGQAAVLQIVPDLGRRTQWVHLAAHLVVVGRLLFHASTGSRWAPFPQFLCRHNGGIRNPPKKTMRLPSDTQNPTTTVTGWKRKLTRWSPAGTTTARWVTFAR